MITEIEEIDDSFSNENLQQQTPNINNSPPLSQNFNDNLEKETDTDETNITYPFSPNFGEH